MLVSDSPQFVCFAILTDFREHWSHLNMKHVLRKGFQICFEITIQNMMKTRFHKYLRDCLEPAGCGACAFSYSRVCPPTKFWHKYLFIFPQIFAPPLTNIFGDFWHKFAPSTLKCSIYHKWLCRDIPHQLSYFRVWLFGATLLVGQCWSSSHEAITWIMGSLLWSELGIATHISSAKVVS